MTLREALISIRGSYWYLPTLLVTGCALLALFMVEVDARLPPHALEQMPRLFGAGAEGSRGMLTAIATSNMTVAGVVFSINIVALSLATAQYSPHVLQNFLRDRASKIVLGIFLGTFTYCLIVLRTVRGGADSFVPGTSIVVAIVLALVGVAFLVFFIHHVSLSIRVSQIVSDIAGDTRRVINELYPENGERIAAAEAPPTEGEGIPLELERPPGYVQQIDYDRLADIAEECGALMHIPVAAGDFTYPAEPVAVLYGVERCSPKLQARIRRSFATGSSRNIDQDVSFGLQQLVDVAARALSSSNNDETTAVHALEHLTVLLSMLAGRDVDGCRTVRRGDRVVLVCERAGFDVYVRNVTAPFRRYASRNPLVLGRLIAALERIGAATKDGSDLTVVLDELYEVEETLRTAAFGSADRAALQAKLASARRRFDAFMRDRAGPAAA